MKIVGISEKNSFNTQSSGFKQQDDISKNIQQQIMNLKKQLGEIDANKDISIEEKMEKRKDINQQITDLERQLRQHELEMQKEKQQAKQRSQENKVNENQKNNKPSTGVSEASMQSMITADVAVKQAAKQGNLATKMKGRVGVLESEIKLDAGRGLNVEHKQEELAKAQSTGTKAITSQAKLLAKAGKDIEVAAKEDKAERKKYIKEQEEKRLKEQKEDELDRNQSKVDESTTQAKDKKKTAYKHIDLYL